MPRRTPVDKGKLIADAAMASFYKELLWAQQIRYLHSDDQYRLFSRMEDPQYKLCIDRTQQIIELENAGFVTCRCTRCGGSCPGKIHGGGRAICYECVFGHHRGAVAAPVEQKKTIRIKRKKP